MDKDSSTTSNNLTLISSAIVQCCTIDVRATPCKVQGICMICNIIMYFIFDLSIDSQISTAASWVGGVIIGVVLSTVILLTVLAAVCLWRRKRTHSQHNMYDVKCLYLHAIWLQLAAYMHRSVVSGKEKTASLSHITNDIYVSGTTTQLYEVCQSNEPEYSYTTPHATSTPQQSNSDVIGVSLVDNTALTSTCEEDVHEYI